MPEALARADHDFVVRENPRPAKSRRMPPAKPSRLAFLAPMTRRPGRTILFGAAASVLIGIGVNALFLQSARHPAPFFRGHDAANSTEPTKVAIPMPPARPAEMAAKPAGRTALQPTPAAAPVSFAPASLDRAERAPSTTVETRGSAAAKPVARETSQQAAAPKADPIGAFLREGRPSTPTPPGSIPNPSAEQTKRILAVQEALKKLGHNVKPDGVAGPTTRVAIEAFERTQKLQVSGQMSPRLLRELASRSGVKIP